MKRSLQLLVMLIATLTHLTLFLGVLMILLKIFRPWLITIASSLVLSQFFFIIVVFVSLLIALFLYIKINLFIVKIYNSLR